MIDAYMKACSTGTIPPPVVLPSGERHELARLTKFELIFSDQETSKFFVFDGDLLVCFEQQADRSWCPIWATRVSYLDAEQLADPPYSRIIRAPYWAKNLADPAEPEGEDDECE